MQRPMILYGWYPFSLNECKKELESYIEPKIFLEGINPVAAIVPHAGWYFCGKLSINTIRLLKEKNGDISHIFIFGGHLHKNNLPIIETFQLAKTPFGELKNNQDIVQFLIKKYDVQSHFYLQDNTIEILLPIINYFFKNITITAIYLPPNIKIKKMIEDLYDNFGKNSLFIGSTDLTHYGPNYGFFHNDKSISSVDWVKNKNDKGYIDLLLNLKDKESIDYALENSSACSAGAAYGAIIAAQKAKVIRGNLIGYYTSYDIRKDDSFVGYAGILY